MVGIHLYKDACIVSGIFHVAAYSSYEYPYIDTHVELCNPPSRVNHWMKSPVSAKWKQYGNYAET